MNDEPNIRYFPPTVKRAGDPRGKDATWTLIGSTPDGTCSQCAVAHAPDQPHDAQSLHYQYSFHAEHDRWPTWADAMAHCDEMTRGAWRALLLEHGVPEGQLG